MSRKQGWLWMTMCIVLLTASMAWAGPDGFSGNWSLNKDKSDFTMGRQGGEKPDITMKVEATKDSVKVEQTFSSSQGSMDMKQVFTPDGKSHEIEGPMGSKGNAEAKWDGDKLAVKTVYKFERDGQEMTVTEDSTWELSEDGATLTIKSKWDSPQGSRTGTRIFEKKK